MLFGVLFSTHVNATDYTAPVTTSLQNGDTVTIVGNGNEVRALSSANGTTLTLPGNNTITATGPAAAGLYATGSGSVINATGVVVITTGSSNSFGVGAVSGGVINLYGARISTSGTGSHALKIGSAGSNVTTDKNTKISASGASAYAIQVYSGAVKQYDKTLPANALAGEISATGTDGAAFQVTGTGSRLIFKDIDFANDTKITLGNSSWTGIVASNGFMQFQGNSSASNSRFLVGTGTIGFAGNSTAQGSQFTLNGSSSILDLRSYTGTSDFNVASIDGATGARILIGSNTFVVDGSTSSTFSGTIDGTGRLVRGGSGTLTLSGTNTYSGGTFFNSGAIAVSKDASLGASTGGLNFNGGTLQLTDSFVSARSVTLGAQGGTVQTAANEINELSGGIVGSGKLIKTGAGTLVLSGSNTYSGGTVINGGTVSISADKNLGDATGTLAMNNNATLLLVDSFDNSRAVTLGSGGGTVQTVMGKSNAFAGAIDGSGPLTKSGDGTLTLSGTNTYSGGTFINGGVVSVGADSNLGASSGTLSFDGGTLHLTGSFNNSRAVTLGAGGGTIQTSLLHSNEFSGTIGGTGKLTKNGAGTLTLAGDNSYTGGTVVNAGVLSVSADKNLGDLSGGVQLNSGTLRLTGDVTSDRVVAFDAAGGTIDAAAGTNSTFSGLIDGLGSLTKTGAGTLVLSGSNDYLGGTVVEAGTLSISSNDNLGDAASNLTFNGGTLRVADSITTDRNVVLNANGGTIETTAGTSTSFTQGITGTGKLNKDGDGTLILTGNNVYAGGTHVSKGVLQIGAGSTVGQIGGNAQVDADAALAFDRSDDIIFADVISGEGALRHDGSGKLTLTGENSFTGGTTISAGTLQIGNGSTTGSIAGNVDNNGTLAFNRSNTLDFSGVISGTGLVQQNGAGSLTLSGDSSAFGGSTSVAAGTLLVDGSLGGTVSVASGASLGGGGTIGGNTTVADGATLAGSGAQTLTFDKNLSLGAASVVSVSYGTSAGSSPFLVKGDLALGGVINVTDFGHNGPGIYRVFSYANNLTGTIGLGSLPTNITDPSTVTLQTTDDAVNLINTVGLVLNFWDGQAAGHSLNGQANGGSGTWNKQNNNWTGLPDFQLNGPWSTGEFAIFQGASGIVTIDNSAGTISAAGMQFTTGGYEITGDDLTLASTAANAGDTPIIHVGDGSINDDTEVVTISTRILSTEGIDKTGLGTLVLTADNNYTGGTFVTGGILQLGDGTSGGKGGVEGEINLGSTAASAGTLAINRAGSVTIDNTITGSGHVVIDSPGEIEFNQTNSYLAGTFIKNGVLIVSSDDNLGDTNSDVQIEGGSTLRFKSAFSSSHNYVLGTGGGSIETTGTNINKILTAVTGVGSLTKTGTGTLVFSGDNDYVGVTTISDGTLQIGDGGGTGSVVGDITNNARLAFNRNNAYAYNGLISGTGSVVQAGTGTTTLTGQNTYAGGTVVSAGVLQVSSDKNLGASSGNLTIDGGTFANTAALTSARAVNVTANGGSIRTDATLTLTGAFDGSPASDWHKTGTGLLVFDSSATGDVGAGANVDAGKIVVEGSLDGSFAVNSGATLEISGTQGGDVNVNAGGTLMGSGQVGQNVVVADNGNLQGKYGQTLQIGGNLALDANSQVNVTLGMPSQTALYDVQGNVTLAGSLNITDGGGFGPGLYRLIDYQGNLTDNGMTIGTAPGGDPTRMWIDTDEANKQVNLMSSYGVRLNVWDGGNGAWNLVSDHSNDVWTDNADNIKGPYDQGSFAVFRGTPGTVTISNAAGNVTASGLNFATDGYVLAGDALDLDNTDQPIINVGDATDASKSMTATIAATLTGSKGINKTNYGTLVLTGANSYSGGTTVTGGVLQIGDGGNTGSIKGDVAVSSSAYGDGTLAFNRSDDTEFDGNITGDGKGGVVQKGTGTTTFTGDNTFSGGLTVENGGVKAGVAGHAFGTGTLKVKAGATADLGGFDTTVGGLAAFDASGTTGDGDIALGSGKLTVEQSFDSKFSGVISGAGDLTKSGTGTLTLNTAGTYTGATNVDGGTLKQGAAGVFNNASSGYTVGTDGTLDLGGFDTTLAALSNGGLITMGTQQTAGTTLSVTGNYTGTGGTVVINTVLGDDSSKTDRLKVGGDTSGTTNLKVNNRGGLGAQTVNGIEVVEVAGQSNGTFSLVSDYTTKDGQKAVVGGAYAYTLQQGAGSGNKDGNWYLTSQTTQEPPAPDCQQTNTCPVDPDNPRYSAGVPVYQGYAQNMQVLNKLPTLQERVGNRYLTSGNDNDASNTGSSTVDSRGIWARIEGAHNRLEPHSATGMKQDINSFIMQTGVDGQFYEDANGKLIAGITGQYGTAHGNSSSFFGDGYTDTSAWSLGATATWYGNDGFYVDTQGQLTWFDNDLNSDTANSGLADGAKAFGYALSAEVGQRIALDEHWSLTPQAQLMWSSLDADAFHDIWGNRVHMQDGDSLTARIGLAANYQDSWQGDDGRMVNTSVYGIANVYQEFLGGTRINVAGVNVDTDNDKTWAGIGAGGTYAWADSKYAIYGQGSINTSLNHSTDSYAVKGNAGFIVRW
nr:autotransporter-associated beta strand repeat-containing protein [Brucella anthropi]